tara:strand:+ start:395 stop:1012 length:618 start_codon:yes stop_codon:yes gene_type:complete
MHSYSVKLPPNTDLLQALDQIARNENAFGYVLGVVGNLSRAAFQCPGRAEPEIIESTLEIITLNGTISPEGSHLHLSVSDTACKVWGGHLERGAYVLKGVDILLGFTKTEFNSPIDGVNLDKINTSKIEVYILDNCPWSKRAIRKLDQLNIPHKIILISSDSDFERVNKKSNANKFPQIFIDGNYIGGYDELINLNEKGKLEQLI